MPSATVEMNYTGTPGPLWVTEMFCILIAMGVPVDSYQMVHFKSTAFTVLKDSSMNIVRKTITTQINQTFDDM